MKRVTCLLLAGLFSSQALAMQATTKENHFACLKEEWLDDMVKFVVAKDLASAQAYIKAKRCLVTKGGEPVTVTDGPGAFGSQATYIYKGVKLWTTREALNYGR